LGLQVFENPIHRLARFMDAHAIKTVRLFALG